jgi:hypothetical protein
MKKRTLTQIGLVATLLAIPAKALAADFATNVITSAAADLLIGSGYVSAPLGIAMGYGNGKLTLADRTSALYSGAKLTTDFSTPRLGDYFVEVGMFSGTSKGSFRDLTALFGAVPGSSDYTLKETFLQAYVGRRLARDESDDRIPRWQILARVGFTYIDGALRANAYSLTEDPPIRATHSQDTEDWLGNVGLRADINIRPTTVRLFDSIGLPRPSHSRLVLDGEISGGIRNAKIYETLGSPSDEFIPTEAAKAQDVLTYGGVGRVTLLTAFEIRENWDFVLNFGIQSRYMWVHWDNVPDDPSLPGSRPRSNVRGNELLWGPYFQIGIQHQW